MNNYMQNTTKEKKVFEPAEVEIVVLESDVVITASPIPGEWDDLIMSVFFRNIIDSFSYVV